MTLNNDRNNRCAQKDSGGQKSRHTRVRLNEHERSADARVLKKPAKRSGNGQKTPDVNAPSSIIFLTTAQAAEYLNISPKTLHGWRVTGHRGLRFHRFGRAVRYSRADLDAFAASQCYSSTSAADSAAGTRGACR